MKKDWTGVFKAYPSEKQIYVVGEMPFLERDKKHADNYARSTNQKVEVVENTSIPVGVKKDGSSGPSPEGTMTSSSAETETEKGIDPAAQSPEETEVPAFAETDNSKNKEKGKKKVK